MIKSKIYVCDVDKLNPDYEFTRDVILSIGGDIVSFEEAEICIYNAGVYISRNNGLLFMESLNQAIAGKKKIFITKPYGTSYMPLVFRRMGFDGIELLKSQIVSVLMDGKEDASGILFSRYC